jgi:hypothetical protein
VWREPQDRRKMIDRQEAFMDEAQASSFATEELFFPFNNWPEVI